MPKDAVATPIDGPVARGPILRRVAILLGCFLIGLALFDRGVAWFDAQRDLSKSQMLMADAELAWTNRPGFTNENSVISSLGLRSPEIPADAPRDEVRILGLGASRVFGAGEGGPDMQHTWSAHLEQLCRAELGPRWRVLNGGVIGYSAVQAARRGVRLLETVQPDLVLIFVSPGSQMLMDPSSARHYVHVGLHLLPSDIADATPGALLPAAAALHQTLTHSALYTRYRAKATDQGRRAEEIDKFVLSRAPRSTEVEAMLQRTWAELAALATACRERGVELRVVLVPEPYMDRDDRWQTYLRNNASAGAPPPHTPRREPLDVLSEEARRSDAAAWSLLPALNVIGSDRARYTCDKAHWSDAGHRVVAAVLLDALRADGLQTTLPRARASKPRE
jgi:hypothetical protein